MASASNPLISLQYGRALAALSVAAFHLSIMMGVDRYGGQAVFEEYTHRGNLGVDFFFVLSGFIIMLAHQADINEPKKFGSYIWKRFCRVYPIYWLYTILFIILVILGFGQKSNPPDTWTGWLTSFTLIRFSSDSPPLSPAWTLFHEIAFYATFSLLLLNRRLGFSALAAWAMWSVAHFSYTGVDNRTAFNVYSSAHILHFLLGMGAYCSIKHLNAIRSGVWIGAAAVLASVGMVMAFPRGHELHNLCWALVFASLIAWLTHIEHRASSIEHLPSHHAPCQIG